MSKKLKTIGQLKRKPKTLQELFKNPKRWTKGRYKDRKTYDESTCFCLIGGIIAVYGDDRRVEYKVSRYLESTTGNCSISSWNDNEQRTFEDVRKLVEELNI